MLDAAAGTFLYPSYLLSLYSRWLLFLSAAAKATDLPKISYVDNEAEFRWALLQDSMAFDKLHEGIKKFAEDGETLKALLRKKIEA